MTEPTQHFDVVIVNRHTGLVSSIADYSHDRQRATDYRAWLSPFLAADYVAKIVPEGSAAKGQKV